jgi:hypothetical protein
VAPNNVEKTQDQGGCLVVGFKLIVAIYINAWNVNLNNRGAS